MGTVFRGGYSNLSTEKIFEDLKAENEKLKTEIQRIGSVGEKILLDLITGEHYSGYGNTWCRQEGMFIHVHVGIKGLPANASSKVFTIPNVSLDDSFYAVGIGDQLIKNVTIYINKNGEAGINPGNSTYATMDFYILARK